MVEQYCFFEYHLSIYNEYFICVDVNKVWTYEDDSYFGSHLGLYATQ